MAEKVIRRQFRGCLKEDAREGTRLCMAAAEAEKEAQEADSEWKTADGFRILSWKYVFPIL